MPITFVSVNTVASATNGDLSVTPQTTQTGDIMVCAVTTRDTVTSSFPAGWTVTQSNNGSITGIIAWKRCVGDESGSAFDITHPSGGHIIARISLYRGCAQDNPTTAVTITSNGASTLCSAPVDVTEAGCFVVFTNHIQANTTGFTNFRLLNTNNDGVCKERFLRFGDKVGSGGNTTFVDLSDNGPLHAMSGNLIATISASTANLAGVAVLRPQLDIVAHNNLIATLNGKIAVGNV